MQRSPRAHHSPSHVNVHGLHSLSSLVACFPVMCACSHSRLCQVQVEGGGASEEKFGSMCSSVLSSYHLLSKTLEEVCVLVCMHANEY